MKYFLSGFSLLVLLFGNFQPIALAQEIDKCRISASERQIVSLGFPLRSERIASKPNPKIMVIPYRLAGDPDYVLTDIEKNKFIQAGENIKQYSNNKSQINFVFSSSVDVPETAEDMNVQKSRQSSSWNEGNYQQSTFGFVSRVISQNDKILNFTDIDGVILYGQPRTQSYKIAEAMMYTGDSLFSATNKKKQDGTPWFEPLKTNEGEIFNAILLFNESLISTITHEIMHLYGLIDLYGSSNSPRLSLMADGSDSLLPFEKWILGWLPDSSVQCVSEENEIFLNLSNNKFSINYVNGDKSLIIPTGKTSALIIDVLKLKNDQSRLFFYSLDNETRPPITCFNSTNSACGDVVLNQYGGVGKQFVSSNYTLLVTENNGSSVELIVIPNSQVGTEEMMTLMKKAESKSVENELRAKQELEAADKAAADLIAQQNAVAPKVVQGKKKTITCTKGKLTKKVTAIKPKCPAGYKKK